MPVSIDQPIVLRTKTAQTVIISLPQQTVAFLLVPTDTGQDFSRVKLTEHVSYVSGAVLYALDPLCFSAKSAPLTTESTTLK